MEQTPQGKSESSIEFMEIAVHGAEAELDEAEALLREAETTKIQLETALRRSGDNPKIMRDYQNALIKIKLLTEERDKFSADLRTLREDLHALHDLSGSKGRA